MKKEILTELNTNLYQRMLVVGRTLKISLHGTIKRTQTLSMSNVLGQVRYSLKVFITFFSIKTNSIASKDLILFNKYITR